MTVTSEHGPSGIVTFLFTDVEGSTRLWAADVNATGRSLVKHDELVKRAVVERDGYVFGWAGDHFRAAFEDPKAAVAAAVAIQQQLEQTDWDDGPQLRVRMGLHRGRATQRDGDYFGPVPNTAARVESLANGGQILMTEAVQAVVDIESRYLGSHRLRDVPDPVDIHQVGIDSHRALRAVDPALTTLPAAGSAIIGRADEVREIRALLESASMVTLTGIGGCGKTRLAVEVGFQELPGRSGGCYFADLSAVSDAEELPAAIARAIRFELAGATPALDQIVDHLATRDALLILDNCEHILDACASFAEALLRQSSATALLATTRQRLGVDGEVVVAVPSLSHGGPHSPAIQLFVDRAGLADPTFELSDQDRFTVGEICGRLDGMPLAIELAAARIAVLSPSEILDRMADRFRLLSGGIGRHRRRTLQATLDWSYDLLDEPEQEFFQCLGLFVGSFDLAAASAVAELDEYDAMDMLGSLVAKSLVVAETDDSGTSRRYRLLETVRIYAGDQLARSEHAASALDAYVTHYQSMTHAETFAIASSLDRAIVLEWQWPNIAATLDHLATEERWIEAARIGFGVQGLWDTQVSAVEGRRWLDRILTGLLSDGAAADAVPDGRELRDWIQYMLALVEVQLDGFDDVFRLLQGLIDDESAAPGPRSQAAGLFAFMCCRQHAERVLPLVGLNRQLVSDHDLGSDFLAPAEWAVGCLALYNGEFDGARVAFQHAHNLLEHAGPPSGQKVMSGLSLAAAEVMVDRPEAAIELLDSFEWSKSVWDSCAHDRPTRAIVITVATAALAITLLDQLVRVRIMQGDGAVSSVAFIALAVLLVLSEIRPTTWTRVGERDGVTRGWAFAYALILLGNPILAITVMVAARCFVDLQREKSAHEIVFDSAQIVASLSLGSLVLAVFGVNGNITQVTTISVVECFGIVLGGLSIFGLNALLTATAIGLEQHAGIVRSVRAALALSWTADGALLVLAPVFAIAAETPVVIVSLVIIAVGVLIGSVHGAVRRDETATPLRLLPPIDADVIHVDLVDADAIDALPADPSTRLALVYSADGS